jgi:hypothetical protein
MAELTKNAPRMPFGTEIEEGIVEQMPLMI